jgi:hypothetical protein
MYSSNKVPLLSPVWFDRGDNRPSGVNGGDFAYGHSKGQCPGYATGVAFNWTKKPAALLCSGP